MAKEKEFTFGTCEYERISPQKATLSADTSVLNVILPFEEALKLNLAVDECVRKLNKYKKSTTEGKRTALNLTVHFHLNRIAINEGKLQKRKKEF
jgi:hypothetical protein